MTKSGCFTVRPKTYIPFGTTLLIRSSDKTYLQRTPICGQLIIAHPFLTLSLLTDSTAHKYKQTPQNSMSSRFFASLGQGQGRCMCKQVEDD